MRILHLTASPFFGGPERVILDIVRAQSAPEFDVESLVVSFSENGNCRPFIEQVEKAGFSGRILKNDMPRLVAATVELSRFLRDEKIDVIVAHGHKSRMVGWFAARRTGIPIVGVSHGWTWQDWKTSIYERIDQWMHRCMDRVVCVSQGQADKVIRTGTPKNRVVVIHNAIDFDRFQREPDPEFRKRLENYFTRPPTSILGAAGRLSPEKGFDVMIDAVRIALDKSATDFGVVLFGEGFLREPLQARIDAAGIGDRFKMVGFTNELDKFLPWFDVFMQSSHTEGFPCVNVEAMACRVPVLATAVGGVPEQIEPERNGLLVPDNDPESFALALQRLLDDVHLRKRLGDEGRRRAETEFTCREQARKYLDVFQSVVNRVK